jgi:glycine oxidase
MKPATIVIGAGIIGSAIAYELSKRGHSVLLMETLSDGGATSIASGGMVNPYSGFDSITSKELETGTESLRLYPEWASILLDESGVDIEWQACGSLQIALSESDEAAIHESFPTVQAYVPYAAILSGEETRKMEPLITPACRSALWVPDEGQVNPQRLLRALRLAASRYGAELYRGQTVLGFETAGEQVIGVRTPSGVVRADWIVTAAGAWSGTLLSSLGLQILIQPVEHVGFDMRPTAEGFAHLLTTLEHTFPGLLQATYVGYTVGLRPATQDGKPLIGFVPPWRNLLIASGHGRHGVLLAPSTARTIADLIAF